MSDSRRSPPASREFVFRTIQLLMLVDIAIGEHGIEGELEKLVVARIGFQRRAVIGGGGGGVATHARMSRRKIIARDSAGLRVACRHGHRLRGGLRRENPR